MQYIITLCQCHCPVERNTHTMTLRHDIVHACKLASAQSLSYNVMTYNVMTLYLNDIVAYRYNVIYMIIDTMTMSLSLHVCMWLSSWTLLKQVSIHSFNNSTTVTCSTNVNVMTLYRGTAAGIIHELTNTCKGVMPFMTMISPWQRHSCCTCTVPVPTALRVSLRSIA